MQPPPRLTSNTLPGGQTVSCAARGTGVAGTRDIDKLMGAGCPLGGTAASSAVPVSWQTLPTWEGGERQGRGRPHLQGLGRSRERIRNPGVPSPKRPLPRYPSCYKHRDWGCSQYVATPGEDIVPISCPSSNGAILWALGGAERVSHPLPAQAGGESLKSHIHPPSPGSTSVGITLASTSP